MTTAQEFNNQIVDMLGNAKQAIAMIRDILEKHTDAIYKLAERIEILEEKEKQQ